MSRSMGPGGRVHRIDARRGALRNPTAPMERRSGQGSRAEPPPCRVRRVRGARLELERRGEARGHGSQDRENVDAGGSARRRCRASGRLALKRTSRRSLRLVTFVGVFSIVARTLVRSSVANRGVVRSSPELGEVRHFRARRSAVTRRRGRIPGPSRLVLPRPHHAHARRTSRESRFRSCPGWDFRWEDGSDFSSLPSKLLAPA